MIRKPSLPPGWYPGDKKSIDNFLKSFKKTGKSLSVIAPHAGWYYSGKSAALSISSLDKNIDTVVIIGGHLSANSPILLAEEEGVQTPFGVIKIDREFRDVFSKEVNSKADIYRDNTIEVLLPMVHYFFPDTQILWTRFPENMSAYKTGQILGKISEQLKRKIAVIGSADLTHYGANYGFAPHGRGEKALEWVRDVNDAKLISAILDGNPSLVLECSQRDSSTCSAGAILGAMGYASTLGASKAELLDYSTSADADKHEGIPDSFVGYAAIKW
jgi:AmmeMemoRadiSam system protein B